MIDPQTLDRIRPVVRRLRETKPSIAEILHVRIDAAIKLIEEQAEEITRLKEALNAMSREKPKKDKKGDEVTQVDDGATGPIFESEVDE